MNAKPENILLIVVDSLRADRLSCYGYEKETSPFIDSLAGNGLKFENAYSIAPWTVPVHGSLFTGQLPSYHGSHRKSKTFKQPSDQSLAGTLSDRGYTTAGFSANPWLSPGFDFDTGFDHYKYLTPQPPFPDEALNPEADGASLSSVTGILEILSWAIKGNPIKRVSNGFWNRYLAKSFVSGSQITDKISTHFNSNTKSNNFIFANYMDVHAPHYEEILGHTDVGASQKKLSETGRGQNYTHPLIKKKVDFQTEPEHPNRARTLYDQAIREVDNEINKLFKNLSNHIDLEKSLTIILGDHGECMGEYGYWGHGTYLHDELIKIPLIIDLPEWCSSEPVDPNAPISLLSLFGFMNSIADGSIESDEENLESIVTDEPLFAECTGPRPNMEGKASEGGYQAVIDAGWKLIRNRSTDNLSFTKVSNLSSDELSQEEAKEHLEELEHSRWKEPMFQQGDDESSISSETENRLSDLGYL